MRSAEFAQPARHVETGLMLDYLGIFRELNANSIRYVVVGGMAVNMHGVPRKEMTDRQQDAADVRSLKVLRDE